MVVPLNGAAEPAVNVRALGRGDLDALLALYRHLHVDDLPLPERGVVEAVWAEALGNPRGRCLGGFSGADGDTLVSSCAITLIPNLTRGCRPYGVIENVVTHADHRGRGFGRRLLHEALAWAWSAGSYKVMLLTGRTDEGTLLFYERAGFSRHGKTGFVARPPGAA